MKTIAIYAENPKDPAVAAKLKEARKGEDGARLCYRSVRFFNPGQRENFDLAVVDTAAPGGAELADILAAWGVEVFSTGEYSPPKPKGKARKIEASEGKKTIDQLEQEAAGLGLSIPKELKDGESIEMWLNGQKTQAGA